MDEVVEAEEAEGDPATAAPWPQFRRRLVRRGKVKTQKNKRKHGTN